MIKRASDVFEKFSGRAPCLLRHPTKQAFIKRSNKNHMKFNSYNLCCRKSRPVQESVKEYFHRETNRNKTYSKIHGEIEIQKTAWVSPIKLFHQYKLSRKQLKIRVCYDKKACFLRKLFLSSHFLVPKSS